MATTRKAAKTGKTTATRKTATRKKTAAKKKPVARKPAARKKPAKKKVARKSKVTRKKAPARKKAAKKKVAKKTARKKAAQKKARSDIQAQLEKRVDQLSKQLKEVREFTEKEFSDLRTHIGTFIDEHETLKGVTDGISKRAKDIEVRIKKIVTRGEP
jgi:hypothetical protein